MIARTNTFLSIGKRFFGTGFWSMVDQAVLALGIFALNVMVARGLGQAEFGSYALINGTVVLAVTIVGSLLSYPLTLRGANATDSSFQQLLGIAVTLSIFFSLSAAPVIAALMGYMSYWQMIPLVLATMVLKTVQGVQRSGFVSRLHFGRVLVGDVIASLGPPLGILILLRMESLSLVGVFACLLLGNAASVGFQFHRSNAQPAGFARAAKELPLFWSLGKWSALNKYLTSGATLQLFPWAMGLFHGATSVASFQATSTVSNLVSPIANGISIMILPLVVRAKQYSALTLTVRYGVLGFVLMSPFLLLIWGIPETMIRLAYGENSPYEGLGNYVRVFTGLVILRYISTVIGALLQGLGYAKSASHGATVSFLIGTVVVVPFVMYGEVLGAILGMMLMAIIRISINLMSTRSALSGQVNKSDDSIMKVP